MSKSSKKETNNTTEKKMGLTLFLQNNPQKPGITAILETLHSKEVKTLSEWKDLVVEILEKKIKS